MRVLTFVSGAPGSGKTVLAGHLAAQADAEGIGPVVLLDGDPEGGMSRWWQARNASRPVLCTWDHSCTAAGFKQLATAGAKLVVIDTPSAPSARLETAISLADLVVIPIRPNPEHLEIVGGTVDTVEALGKPFVFLINRSDDDGELATAAAIALAQHGTVCPVIFPERADFSACRKDGRTVMDLDPQSPASEDIARLWDYLAGRTARVARPEGAAGERPDTPKDRRRFARHRYDQIATATIDGKVYPCRVTDISAGGITIWTAGPPPTGANIVLHIPYLGEFKAEAVHGADERIGLKFLVDEPQQGDFVERLSALIRLGRPSPKSESSPEPATG